MYRQTIKGIFSMSRIDAIQGYNSYLPKIQAFRGNESTDNKVNGVESNTSNVNLFAQPAVNTQATDANIFTRPVEATSPVQIGQPQGETGSPVAVSSGPQAGIAPADAKDKYERGLAPGNQCGMYNGDAVLGKELYYFA